MPLTETILRRLAAVGITSEADLSVWRALGDNPRVSDAEFLRRLRLREAVGAEYRRRLPQLQTFAAGCRRHRPLPTVSDMSVSERAQHDILLGHMRRFVQSREGSWFLHGFPNCVPIVHTSRTGLLAAHGTFGRSPAVILEEPDWERWCRDRRADESDGSKWSVRAWWLLGEEADGRMPFDSYRRAHPLPAGHSCWVLRVGSVLKSLHELQSLLRWDGVRATDLNVQGSIDGSLG